MGNSTGKIYVDITGRYDTVVWEAELESLDQFFTLERGIYVDTDEDTKQLIDRLNANTVGVSGSYKKSFCRAAAE